MNKILAALNHSSVQIGAAERGSRKDALHLLNKVKKGIESSDCPQDIKEWFATALSMDKMAMPLLTTGYTDQAIS
jgi:hypothetical protein